MTTLNTSDEQLIMARTDEFCAMILAYAETDFAYTLVLVAIETMIEMQTTPSPLLAILDSAFSGYAIGRGYEAHYREFEVKYLARILGTMEAYSEASGDSERQILQ